MPESPLWRPERYGEDMAELAGLKLSDRYSGWNGEPFDQHSGRNISVYEKNSRI